MKKLFYLSITALALLFTSVACSDDDDYTPPPQDTQLEKIIKELEKMGNVDDFTSILKDVEELEIGDEAVTVFAVKDAAAESSAKQDGDEPGEDVTADNIKRHIVKGTYELTDSLLLKSVSGEPVVITLDDQDQVYVNGVLMESAEPTKVGESQIYVMAAGLPEAETFESTFSVFECNEEWADGADEKIASKDAVIKIYALEEDEYVLIDTVVTDADGKATIKHLESGDFFYTVVKKEGDNIQKTPLRDNYLVLGLFTLQSQIDEADYETETYLDNIELGSLRIADLDGDGKVNASDKIESGYLTTNKEAELTEVTLVSADYGKPEE